VQRHGALHQFQPVHARHAHIREQDIRHIVHHAIQRRNGVAARSGNGNVHAA